MFQDPQQEFEVVGAYNLHVPLSKQIMVFLNPNLRNVCNFLMAETTLGSKNYEVPADEPKKRKNTELGEIARFVRNTTFCQVVIHHTWYDLCTIDTYGKWHPGAMWQMYLMILQKKQMQLHRTAKKVYQWYINDTS